LHTPSILDHPTPNTKRSPPHSTVLPFSHSLILNSPVIVPPSFPKKDSHAHRTHARLVPLGHRPRRLHRHRPPLRPRQHHRPPPQRTRHASPRHAHPHPLPRHWFPSHLDARAPRLQPRLSPGR